MKNHQRPMPRPHVCSGLTRALALAAIAPGVAAAEPSPWPDGLKIEGRVAFTEGPAWDAANGHVYFTDIENDRIMRRNRDGTIEVYRTPSGRANGLAFDPQGRLLACEGGNRRVTRTEPDGSITVLADRFDGHGFNAPNDLVIAADGSVYFTDPKYGDRSAMEILDAAGKPVEGVYRIAPDGTVTRVITHQVDRPNGIAIHAGHLIVADNVNSGDNDGVGGNRKLWRFQLNDDGSIAPDSRELLFDWGTERGPDGIAIGPDGNVYAAAGFNFPNLPAETADRYHAGVYVIDADTKQLLETYRIPEDMITNCTFGGTDGHTLFVTAGHKLWSLRLDPGQE